MVVEFLIAGLKYPGFLRGSEPDPDDYGYSTVLPDSGGEASGSPAGGENAEDDIPLRYSREQIAAVTPRTDPVSWWEPRADFGDVTVQMDSWVLESENDELAVRELPEISEGEEGWGIRAYDFSLASGQDSFSTDVVISIPRTAENALASCVWFNEEEDVWEDIYYEISEDGKSYLIYTDHFSLFGEKLYRFDAKKMDLVESDGSSLNLNSGIFVEVPRAGEDHMKWNVKVDYDRMWNLYQKKTEEDIRGIADAVQDMMQKSDDIAANRRVYKYLDDFQSIFGDADSVTTLTFYPSETAEEILHGVQEAESDYLGDFLLGFDLLMTSLKIVQEAKNGSYIMEEVVLKLPSAVMAHAGDLAGAGVTILAGAYLAPFAAALVGLTWWAGGKLMDLDFMDKTFIDPTLESLHQYQSSVKSVRMTYGEKADPKTFFNNPKRTIPMSKPSSMTEADFAVLKKTVEKTPLQRFSRDEIGSAQDFYNYYAGSEDASGKMLYKGWSEAFLAILSACSDDGQEYLSTVLDEFYWNYAYSFWELDEEILDRLCYSYYSTEKEGSLASIRELNGGEPLTGAIKIRCTEDFVQILKQETKPILLKALSTLQRQSCQALMKDVRSQILPLMNCRLTFQVQDQSLGSDSSFQNSIYCVDWTTINANHYYAAGEEGRLFNDPSFVTPMRFAGVEGPCFLPLLPSDQVDRSQPSRNRPENYYPYRSDFVPRANPSDNTVFECTYYHYLMMGAPLQMIFKDVSDPRAYKDAPEVTARIMMPKLSRETAKTYQNKYTGFSYQVSAMTPVREAVVPVIIPKADIKVPALETDLVFLSTIQESLMEKGEMNFNSHLSLKGNGEFSLSVPVLDEHYDNGYYTYSLQQDAMNIRGQATVIREETDLEGRKYTLIGGPIEGGGSFYRKHSQSSPSENDSVETRVNVTQIQSIRADADHRPYFEIYYYPQDGYCGVSVRLCGDVRTMTWNEINGTADTPYDETGDSVFFIKLKNRNEERTSGVTEIIMLD